MVACREMPVNKVLQAHYDCYWRLSGNLTVFDQAVFRAKNLKKFSDINLSYDGGFKPFMYAVRTVFVGFVTFSDPVYATREWTWPG
jgi:hypothetical protein